MQFRKSPSSSELASKHSLSEIHRLYDFDSRFRSLIRHYIEINEVYYKTHISNEFALLLSVLRNKCAHAARLINTRYNPPAKLSQKFLRDNPSVSNDSLFAYLKVLLYRLPSDDLRNEFKSKLFKLIEEYQDVVDLSLIGFPMNYKNLL
ncbi:Abi family protein [Butyrivibrio sp. LB2008]|uniref:Abi family protein n=1 Tax=Butyrivibrio sp. LB2008 TaxID=1408305 RepID=UPI00047EF290